MCEGFLMLLRIFIKGKLIDSYEQMYSTAHMKFIKIMLTCGQTKYFPFIIYLSIDLFMLEKIKL